MSPLSRATASSISSSSAFGVAIAEITRLLLAHLRRQLLEARDPLLRRPVVAIKQFVDLRLADRHRRQHVAAAVLRQQVLRHNSSRMGVTHTGLL
jgi:hypothetical protein